jgi:phosphoribosylformylglycinamidine synthase
MRPRVLILRAPGTNCDEESAFAFDRAGATAERIHIARVLESPRLLSDFQILCLPGGFSYGDDIAAGRILGNQIRHHLADACREFRDAGKLVLGICNGFQILLKSGLMDLDDATGPQATLTWNDSAKFEARWVRLAVAPGNCVFLQGIEAMELPVAHAEGKFVTRDEATLSDLDRAGRLVLRYATIDGPIEYPANPNGAMGDVAGLCDRSGRVLGLMPHPERFIDPTQHPRWTRERQRKVGEGLRVFENAVRYFK